MSDQFYDNLWLETKEEIKQVINQDIKVQKNPKSEETLKQMILVFFRLVILIINHLNHQAPEFQIKLSARYRRIVSSLIQCFFQTIPRKKLEVIEKFLGCSIARMLEYKTQLMKYEWVCWNSTH